MPWWTFNRHRRDGLNSLVSMRVQKFSGPVSDEIGTETKDYSSDMNQLGGNDEYSSRVHSDCSTEPTGVLRSREWYLEIE